MTTLILKAFPSKMNQVSRTLKNIFFFQKSLKNRFAPEANFDFPKTIKHGCNRSCKTVYFSISSSIVIKIMLPIVPIVCYLSPDRRSILGGFVNCGYRKWHNIMEKEKNLSQNTYHLEAVTLALATIDRFE